MFAHCLAFALALLAAAVPCLSGCNNTPSKPKQQGPPPLDLSSPAATLAALRTAYMARDSVSIARLFEDDFVFVFSPRDLIGDNPIPFDHWPLEDELLAARRMFRDARVDKITLSFETGDTIPSGDVIAGSYKLLMDQIHLSVFVTVDNLPWEYRVTGANAWFYFRSSAGEDGRRIWRIVRWEDQPGVADAPLKTGNEANWGRIKFLYHS